MNSESPAPRPLSSPTTAQLLDEVLTLGREIHLELDEPELVARFLQTLTVLFPGRAFAVRAVDPRSPEGARVYGLGAELREGLDRERIAVKSSSVAKTRLKSAVTHSARIRLSERWDSPFPGIFSGFAVPLVASGEFYGVLDVGYPMEVKPCESDESQVIPIANHLSVTLRNERLHRETTVLRDYQAKLIEHANALILGVDRHWRITVCNQALCRLTGFDRHEVIGRDSRDWLSGEDVHKLTSLLARVLDDGRRHPPGANADTVDVTLKTRSGQVRTVWSVAAISGRSRVEAVVAIGQDQTVLRQLQSQVIQAEKLATLGQLAAGVVHELNNPLTSITVYAQYLFEKANAALSADRSIEFDRRDVEKLRRIGAGARRISEFAKELVQYAKPSTDEVELVDLKSVAKQSLAFCEHLFERTQVTALESFATDLAPVFAVSGQLEQVMINLITNAVHAVGERGTVTVRTFAPDADHVALVVADDGPGIPAETRKKVFEPFFTTKTAGKGTGLGLSIVHNIVEQHGGRIEISDATGGGAVFTIVLPAIQRTSG